MKKENISPDRMVSVENSYNLYARYYDIMTSRHVEDLSIYDQIAATKPPPYLEVGCGTGRVLSHLLSKKPDKVHGHYLSGVDISDAMLSICTKKNGPFIDDGSLQVTKHDFSSNSFLEQKFHAAFVTFFTFNYIPEHLQSNFLANISQSLHSDGVIILDCFYPYLKWHPEKPVQWVDKEPIVMGDTHIGFQEKTQMVTPIIEKREWIFTEPHGVVNTITTNKIYISPEKGKSLLETAGFTDILRVFDYKLPGTDDFTEGFQGYNFVLMARKP